MIDLALSDLWMKTRTTSPLVGIVGDTFRGLPAVQRVRMYATSNGDAPAFDNFPNINRLREAIQQRGPPAPPASEPAPARVKATGEGSRVINAVSTRKNRRVITV